MNTHMTNNILVMPNDQELSYAKRLGGVTLYPSPFAVRNRNVSHKDLPTFAGTGQKERDDFQEIAQTYPLYKFLYHAWFRKGTTLSSKHLQAIDTAQDIPETPLFLAYQESADVPAKDFMQRLDDVQRAQKSKTVIPTIDPADKDILNLKKKCEEIVKRGYELVVVLYRNPATHLPAWQTIQSTLDEHGIKMLALGVERRWSNSLDAQGTSIKVSTLCAPLLFGVTGVAHYRPRRGGTAPAVLLTDDLLYEPVAAAGTGRTRYNGQTRQNEFAKAGKLGYEFTRVDSVMQAQEVLQQLPPLTAKTLVAASTQVQGIGHFAKKYRII